MNIILYICVDVRLRRDVLQVRPGNEEVVYGRSDRAGHEEPIEKGQARVREGDTLRQVHRRHVSAARQQ